MTPDRGRPDDVRHRPNWVGGYYGLSAHLGPSDDDRLVAALQVLWSAPGLRWPQAAPTAPPLWGAPTRGVARLPGSRRAVCAVVAGRENGEDRLDLGVPLGALCEADRRVGGYPFDDPASSRGWREPLDARLAEHARRIFAAVPFEHAVIGFEVSGLRPADVVDASGRRRTGVLVRQGNVLVHRAPSGWGGSAGATGDPVG